jgi:hypothetical protein
LYVIDNSERKDVNFDERYRDFDCYREVIKRESQKFIEDLREIFKRD